jgi:hypothetical protein
MIPRRFGSTAPFAGSGGHKRGHKRAASVTRPGDVVEVEVARIGVLSNPVAAAAPFTE